jgi:beta-galactosidase beta subunit
MLFGGLVGWGTRVLTLHDQYISVQILLQDAETKYYKKKTDQLIQENERIYKHGK